MGIKRKSHFKGSQEAVSEIIGTLFDPCHYSDTVLNRAVLCGADPPPHQNTNVDFGTEPIIQHQQRHQHGHMGQRDHGWGPDPQRWYTSIAVFVNERTSTRARYSNRRKQPQHRNDWKIGETWSLRTNRHPPQLLRPGDGAGFTSSNSVVWESKLPLPIKSIPVIGDKGDDALHAHHRQQILPLGVCL